MQESIAVATENITDKEHEESLPSMEINYEALEVDYTGLSRTVLTGLTEGLMPKVITTGPDGSLYTVLKSDDVDGKLQQMLLWKRKQPYIWHQTIFHVP